MTEAERDKVQEDILYELRDVKILLERLVGIFDYPLSVHETGEPTKYY